MPTPVFTFDRVNKSIGVRDGVYLQSVGVTLVGDTRLKIDQNVVTSKLRGSASVDQVVAFAKTIRNPKGRGYRVEVV